MTKYPNIVMENLSSLISEMAENPMLFVKHPNKDFTRDRKLPFETVVKLLISKGGNSIYKELLESQNYDLNIISPLTLQCLLPCSPWNSRRNNCS